MFNFPLHIWPRQRLTGMLTTANSFPTRGFVVDLTLKPITTVASILSRWLQFGHEVDTMTHNLWPLPIFSIFSLLVSLRIDSRTLRRLAGGFDGKVDNVKVGNSNTSVQTTLERLSCMGGFAPPETKRDMDGLEISLHWVNFYKHHDNFF